MKRISLLLGILLLSVGCQSEYDCGVQTDPACNLLLAQLIYTFPETDQVAGATYFGIGSTDVWRRDRDGSKTQLISTLTNLGQISVNLDLGYIFIGDTNAILRFDLNSGSLVTIVSLGANPLGVAYNPNRGVLYYTVTGDPNIYQTGPDGGTGSVFASSTQPALMAYDSRQKRLYIGDITAQTITSYIPETGVAEYSANIGEAPFGLAVDHPDFASVYYTTSGSGTVRRLDTNTDTVSDIATGLGNVTGIDIDAATRQLYFNDRTGQIAFRYSLQDGTLSQIDTGSQFTALKLTFEESSD